MAHTVKSAVVKVAVGPASGNRVARILRRGDVVPEGVSEDLITSLEERGLIEKVAEPEPEPSEAEQEAAAKAAADKAAADKAEADKKAAAAASKAATGSK